MKTQELEKPLEWSELGADPVETLAQEAKRLLLPIPDSEWQDYGRECYRGKYCALGHLKRIEAIKVCDIYTSDINKASMKFFKTSEPTHGIAAVNDGLYHHTYKQSTPKDRVIALLDDMIKAGF